MSDETTPKEALRAPPPRASAEPDAVPLVPVVVPVDIVHEEISLVPVRSMVLFPGVVLPVVVTRPRSVEAIQEAVRASRPIALILQRDETVDEPKRADLYEVGTIAEIVRYLTAPDGRHHAICQGQERFRVVELLIDERGMRARIERLASKESEDEEAKARFLALKAQAKEVLELAPNAPEELVNAISAVASPSLLADMIATFLDVTPAQKQEILETLDVKERMAKVAEKLGDLAKVLRLSVKIREETKGTLDKAQREYFLREQLKQIQKELSGEEGERDDLVELKAALDAAKMPADVDKEVRKDLRRLERMNEGAAEHSMLRAYLDVVAELPWAKRTDDELDLARARKILDEDHHGLDKVKRLILEYLAVRKLKPDGRRPNLCLVGPPGVGKTSLGQSIAKAMGRKFVRASLGGVHDEAEIRGHRRTYIGALPGIVIQNVRKAGSKNPVFMLDEMDKLGASAHGDPSSALLEVLDPEQNGTFRDNYLGVPFDLSEVLFIGTANVLEQIPGPLRDRFEVIQIPGYTREERLAIATKYLWPRQLEQNGLSEKRCKLAPGVIERVLDGWTREAGVRGLERMLAALVRHVAVRVASGDARSVTIKPSMLDEILGPKRFENEVKARTSVPGVATGLAWTPFGGEILFVEATSMPGKGALLLTGQLGDVMRESAQAALSLVKSRLKHLGLDPRFFETHDVHVHLPAGAIQKDGPSAGVALYTALVSLFSGRNVRSDVAMTGEISLRGLVLPVGGIKEKVLGAHAAGIRTILLPRRNEADVREVPESTRKDFTFHFLDTVDDAARLAIEDGTELRLPAAPRSIPAKSSKSSKKRRARRA